MNGALTLDQVLPLIERLSPVDKVRLIEYVVPLIKEELRSAAPKQPRKSLRGLWRGLDITEEEIDEARREMWANFPREDI